MAISVAGLVAGIVAGRCKWDEFAAPLSITEELDLGHGGKAIQLDALKHSSYGLCYKVL